jgi:hypothetical protein
MYGAVKARTQFVTPNVQIEGLAKPVPLECRVRFRCSRRASDTDINASWHVRFAVARTNLLPFV